MRSISLPLSLVLGLAFALPNALVAADPVELSAPVRVLGAAPAAEAENMRARPAPAEPNVTRGLLPQYQGTHAFRSDAQQQPDPDKSALRFLLAMPDRLLLVEASVTINGQPFEMIREKRIDRLIADLTKPAPEESAPEESAPTDPATEPAEEAAEEENAAEQVKPADEPGEESSESEESAAEPEVELLEVPGSALEARLRRYAAVTGRPPSRDEVRWLLTKWVDGPTLLLLDENFQRFRSSQAPAFQVLDRDMDGKVSPAELAAAQETLLSCDVNQNDVVEYTEITEVADDPRRKRSAASVQALIPLLDTVAVANAFRRLAPGYSSPDGLRRVDANSDGLLDESEINKLREREPDVTVSVAFDARDAAKSATTVRHIASDLAATKEQTRILGSSITIPLGGSLLEFSAVQSAALSGSDQISVGVVNDGYPLLPAIDPNEDGRLTIRELRDVLPHLQLLDVDKDGGISPDELPLTTRVSFGLGPSVHQHLADIRSVHPPATAAKVVAPKWFTRMDGNKDGDISPREFLLGAEQFKRLDQDNDGLISPAEAEKATQEKPQKAKPDRPSKPETETGSP